MDIGKWFLLWLMGLALNALVQGARLVIWVLTGIVNLLRGKK